MNITSNLNANDRIFLTAIANLQWGATITEDIYQGFRHLRVRAQESAEVRNALLNLKKDRADGRLRELICQALNNEEIR